MNVERFPRAASQPEPTKDEVIRAIFNTLETMLPYAARMVEENTRQLIEHISALLRASTAQETTLAQLVGCLQYIRMDEQLLSMEEYLKRAQLSLAFSLESNTLVTGASKHWFEQIDMELQALHAVRQDMAGLSQSDGHLLAPALGEFAKTLDRTTQHLEGLKAAMEQVLPTKRDRMLFSQDLKVVDQLLRDQPQRARQLQALLQDANAHARAITDHGRAAIVAIQYQDHHTQLHENATRLLALLRRYVEGKGSEESGAALFEQCFSAISLSEFRSVFLDTFPQDHRLNASAHTSSGGSIELF